MRSGAWPRTSASRASGRALRSCCRAARRSSTPRAPAIRSVGSTGAPLPAEGFRWVYEHVGRDLVLSSASGGTDVCTAFVAAVPLLPVVAGEIPCRSEPRTVAYPRFAVPRNLVPPYVVPGKKSFECFVFLVIGVEDLTFDLLRGVTLVLVVWGQA